MADKVKSQKDKYLDLLEQAYSSAGSKTGVNLSTDEIDSLFTDLTNTDASKVPQWLAANKDKLSMIPEVASIPEFISVTENPKVVEKDYGFTESDDFYKMDGTKSWMNKTIAYLQNNADKYGLTLGEYLDKVRELSTSKDKERQWEENAAVKKFKNVPGIGDVNIPGLTVLALPTSFNKAAMGQEVTGGDIGVDLSLDAADVASTFSPVKAGTAAKTGGSKLFNVLTAQRGLNPTNRARYALSSPAMAVYTNSGRQVKGIHDDTQYEFSPLQTILGGTTAAVGLPVTTRAVGDLIKSGAGFLREDKIAKLGNAIEDVGKASPTEALNEHVNKLQGQIKKYEAVNDVNTAKREINQAKLAKALAANEELANDQAIQQALKDVAEPVLTHYESYNPTAIESKLYGKGTKLWRNVQTGEILTDKQYKDAVNFMKEYNRGPDYQPTPKNVIESQYKRAVNIKNMPDGDILVNAWAEPKIMRTLRNTGKSGAEIVGGRYGTGISEADKKEMAKNIINSAEWAKYVTGLPNNLTEEQIYIATVYGE